MTKIEYKATRDDLFLLNFTSLPLPKKVEFARRGFDLKEIEPYLLGGAREKVKELKQWQKGENYKRGFIFFGEKSYPSTLGYAEEPPFALFWQGRKPEGYEGDIMNAESISLVGGENSDEMGRQASYFFSYECAKNGVVVYTGESKKAEDLKGQIPIANAVVSGSLDAKGKIFVVSTDMNKTLYDYFTSRHRDDGGILGAIPTGNKKKDRQVANYILACVSDSTLLLQAGEKDNCLQVVQNALDGGKEVFVHKEGTLEENNKDKFLERMRRGSFTLVEDGAIVLERYIELSKYTFGSYKYKYKIKDEIFKKGMSLAKEGKGDYLGFRTTNLITEEVFGWQR